MTRSARSEEQASVPAAEIFFDALQDLLRAYQFRDREQPLRCGLSVTACYALEHIVRGGPTTVKELAAALRLDKSTASRVASSLEASGNIARTPHATDKRASWLGATAKGRALHERVRDGLIARQAPLIAHVDEQTLRTMAELLRDLTDGASSTLDAP